MPKNIALSAAIVRDVQDTVVALQALAAFASLTVTSGGDNSGVQINAVYGDSTHRFDRITRENALLLQLVEVNSFVVGIFQASVCVLHAVPEW